MKNDKIEAATEGRLEEKNKEHARSKTSLVFGPIQGVAFKCSIITLKLKRRGAKDAR